MSNDDFTPEELEAQHTGELPGRHLMAGLGLSLPLFDLACVEVYVGDYGLDLYAGLYL